VGRDRSRSPADRTRFLAAIENHSSLAATPAKGLSDAIARGMVSKLRIWRRVATRRHRHARNYLLRLALASHRMRRIDDLEPTLDSEEVCIGGLNLAKRHDAPYPRSCGAVMAPDARFLTAPISVEPTPWPLTRQRCPVMEGGQPLSERGVDFSSVRIVASIFRVIIERQNSFLCSGFSWVSIAGAPEEDWLANPMRPRHRLPRPISRLAWNCPIACQMGGRCKRVEDKSEIEP
jgi:hypothetical protein